MTTTTVEIERTVTEEEQLHLCNECQREVDGNGREFIPRKQSSDASLHFCSECLDEMTDGDIVPEYVELAEDWLDTSWESQIDGNTMTTKTLEGEVKGAAHFSQWAAIIGLLLGVVIVIAPMVGISLPFGNLLPVIYGFGAAVILIANAGVMGDASKAIDKANERVK